MTVLSKFFFRYPVNFDFGKNWEMIADYYLFKPMMLKSRRKGVTRFLKNQGCKTPYYGNQPILEHTNGFLLDDIYKLTKRNPNPYDLEFYMCTHLCHWINPTLSLTLAKELFPTEKWIVRTTDLHTSVFNSDYTKAFDLVYFFNDNRIEDYIQKRPYTTKDKTLGGKEAYLKSTCIQHNKEELKETFPHIDTFELGE